VRKPVFHARAAALDDFEPDEDGGGSLRSRFMRVVRRHPLDALGFAVLLALVMTMLTNALFLQSGKHPAPMRAIGSIALPPDTTGSLVAMPRPRPVEAAQPTKQAASPARPQLDVIADIQKELARKGFYDGATDGAYGPRTIAAMRHFEQAAGLKPGAAPDEDLLNAIVHSRTKAEKPKADAKADTRLQAQAQPHGPRRAEPTPTASPPGRVLAVQRALAEFGYGQIKTTGVFDPTTKSAIEKFERERKLPVSGKLSDRLMKELAAVTGRPLE
jgi:peptidoglycan hydrolase-like protein with peptidoglycan-binding domain